MKNISYTFILVFFSFHANAEKPCSIKDSLQSDTVKYWKKGGVGGINFAQASYTNWAAGGQNSISGTGIMSLFANFKKGNGAWDNNLDLAYGKTALGNNRPRKSDDKIDFSSKYGFKSEIKNIFYTMLFNFKSRFDNGYNYPNDSVIASRFMAPGFFILALGLDYKPNDHFSLFVSPLTGKATLVNDQALADAGAFGVPKALYDRSGMRITPGQTQLLEFGSYLKCTLKTDIMKNVNLQSKLELFSNYLKNPQNVVVNWEILLAMKINKYISASVSTQLLYDDKVNIKVYNSDGSLQAFGPRAQFKEILSIGFSFKF